MMSMAFPACLLLLLHVGTLSQGMSVPEQPYGVYGPGYYLPVVSGQGAPLPGPGSACSPVTALCQEGLMCSAGNICQIPYGAMCEGSEAFCETGTMCEDGICKREPGTPCFMNGDFECARNSICVNESVVDTVELEPHCLFPDGVSCAGYRHACVHGLICDLSVDVCAACSHAAQAHASGQTAQVRGADFEARKDGMFETLGGLAGEFISIYQNEDSLQRQVNDLQQQVSDLQDSLLIQQLEEEV